MIRLSVSVIHCWILNHHELSGLRHYISHCIAVILEAGRARLANLLLCVTLAGAEVTREFDSAGPSTVAHSCGWRVGRSSWLGTQPDFALVLLRVLSLSGLGLSQHGSWFLMGGE